MRLTLAEKSMNETIWNSAAFIDLTFTSLNLSLVKVTISYSKIWLKLHLSEVEATYLRVEFIDLTSTSLKSSLSQIFESLL